MVASLEGIIFGQIYPDNSGGPEFDTDLDGTATQEDEFVSITNTTGAPVDLSGWQIWSDSSGSGAPDPAQDGLYHTFPPGTTLAPGRTLWVINEITGAERPWQQEASEGGVESGGGGPSTNLLTEGQAGTAPESIALVNPATGEYIVFNMAPGAEQVSSLPGFPGTTSLGVIDGNSVQDDAGAGFSYQYDAASDSYTYDDVFIPCFAEGTHIAVPGGITPVERLVPGDLVETLDHGPQELRAVLRRSLDFRAGASPKHLPIAFAAGSLGEGLPQRQLVVSPQHRMLLQMGMLGNALVPAKALVDRPGVRVMRGRKKVTYVQLVFQRHEVVFSEGAPTESFYPGAYAMSACDAATRREVLSIMETGQAEGFVAPARPLVKVRTARAAAVPVRVPTQAALRVMAGAEAQIT